MHIFDRIENREMVALGWTLLHFCWQGTLVAVVYAIADRATRHAANRVRYVVALLTFLLMPAAAIITFVEQQRLIVPASAPGQLATASQLGSLHGAVVTQMQFAAPLVEKSELWIAWNADRLMPWIDGLWLAGMLLLALRSLGGWLRLEQLRRDATILVPDQIRMSFSRMVDRLAMTRSTVLLVSERVVSPIAIGVFRTAVIVPAAVLTQLTPEQLEAVFAHELAHIRRWDYFCNLMQVAVECVLFFHPAVWWISRRARDLRELCCDEVATHSCVDPIVYAETLLRLEEERSHASELALAFGGGGGSLLNRVREVLGERIVMESKPTSGIRLAIASAVVMALLVGPRVADALREDVKTQTNSSATAAVNVQTHAQATSNVNVHVTRVTSAAVSAAPAVTVALSSSAAPAVHVSEFNAESVEETPETKAKGTDYIESMRAAGYPLDLNKDLDTLVTLRSLGITAEYAHGIAQSGLGTPSLQELISLKSLGVTPEYISGLKAQPYAPSSFQDVVSEKSLGVTPDYAKAIGALNLGTPDLHDLISLKAQGITPEYAAAMKASGYAPKDLHELISMRAIGITPEYSKEMASAGLSDLSTQDLISLRAQGVTSEYVRWVKQNFPNAQKHDLEQAAVFHIDAAFVAKAKAHGFTDANLDKLVKLKITGLLD